MTNQRGEFLLTPDLEAKAILARLCRETINRRTHNRRDAQYKRRKNP